MNLMKLLGWQGGTVWDACKEVGLDVNEFFNYEVIFNERGPTQDFRRGYDNAADIALYLHTNKGNYEYWMGAIAAVQNDLDSPRYSAGLEY